MEQRWVQDTIPGLETAGEPVDYEYGVWRNTPSGGEIWRASYTLEEAINWVSEGEESGIRPGVFTVVRRVVSPWEQV